MKEMTNYIEKNEKKEIIFFEFKNMKKCGVLTCIHCIGGRCTNGECDVFERGNQEQ